MMTIDKIIKALKDAGNDKPGKVNDVYIAHDDDCPALITQSLIDCICDPQVKVVERKEVCHE